MKGLIVVFAVLAACGSVYAAGGISGTVTDSVTPPTSSVISSDMRWFVAIWTLSRTYRLKPGASALMV